MTLAPAKLYEHSDLWIRGVPTHWKRPRRSCTPSSWTTGSAHGGIGIGRQAAIRGAFPFGGRRTSRAQDHIHERSGRPAPPSQSGMAPGYRNQGRRLDSPRPRSIPFNPADITLVYADAFFVLNGNKVRPGDDDVPDWGKQSPAAFQNGWGFVVHTEGETLYASGEVPFWFLRHFCTRRAFI